MEIYNTKTFVTRLTIIVITYKLISILNIVNNMGDKIYYL